MHSGSMKNFGSLGSTWTWEDDIVIRIDKDTTGPHCLQPMENVRIAGGPAGGLAVGPSSNQASVSSGRSRHLLIFHPQAGAQLA